MIRSGIEPLPCRDKQGTNTGYRRHSTVNRERADAGLDRLPTCASCRAARAEWQRKYANRRILNRGGVLMIPSAGTQRRLRALAVMGWSFVEIGNRIGGISGAAVSKMATRSDKVLPQTAEKVRALFDEVGMLPGPGPSAVRTRALVKGWAGPLEWDEDTIDDPAVRPQGESAGLRQERVRLARNLAASGGTRGLGPRVRVRPRTRRTEP